jgi:hypothetical protein
MSLLTQTRQVITALGWKDGIFYAASRAVEAASFRRLRIIKYYFVAQPVRDRGLRGAASSSIKTFRAEPNDPIVQQFTRPREVVARRFNDGAICFVAVKADVLVGFLWIQQDRYMEDEVRCLFLLEPAGQAAWDFDVWVAPEFRMTRAFALLWDAANAFLRAHGYCWTLSRISAFNAFSLASHLRLGAEKLHAGLFVLGNSVQLSFLSCPPYLHMSTRENSYPIVRLSAPRDVVPLGSDGVKS